MRLALVYTLAAAAAVAQPHIDNVLIRMIPPGTTSLAGARMDQIKATEFYRKLVEQRKLPQIDEFAAETGFDPRRDVREMLFADTATGGVLMARGSFRLHQKPFEGAKQIRYREYLIWTNQGAGFCILDSTLAVAGDLQSVEASLDEWKAGTHQTAKPLLARAKDVDAANQFWGVSSGFAGFLADHMPRASSGVDFSRIFRGLEDTWFDADFSKGLKGEVHGTAATEKDAMNLRDAARGLVGFGRLSVPENHPEMLKLWDGIQVEQEGRSFSIRADIPQAMVDQLVSLLNSTVRGAPKPGPVPVPR